MLVALGIANLPVSDLPLWLCRFVSLAPLIKIAANEAPEVGVHSILFVELDRPWDAVLCLLPATLSDVAATILTRAA